jgi:hypothetical protein
MNVKVNTNLHTIAMLREDIYWDNREGMREKGGFGFDKKNLKR